MRYPSAGGPLRTLALGLMAAAVGFSIALATSQPRDAGATVSARGAQSRNVGINLRFTNPFFASNSLLPSGDILFPGGGNAGGDPDGFDLGDVAIGTSLIRYINVAGGVKPYTFLLSPLLGSLINPGGTALPVTIPDLSPSGRLTATIPGSGFVGSLLRFDIDLEDAIGTQRSGRFKINFLPAGASFRHAQSQLPLAQLGDTYHTNLETAGGLAPVNFTLVASTITLGTAALTRLEDAGLTLSPDGIIYGRPLKTGALRFTVQAMDARGVIARGRLNGSPHQVYNITIEDSKSACTEMAVTQFMVKGDSKTPGKDSFSYRGVVDLKGDVNPGLAGAPCSFRIGGAVFSGTLDNKGKMTVALGGKAKFSLSITSTGTFTAKLAGGDLLNALAAQNFVKGTDAIVPLLLEVGKLRTAELLTVPNNAKAPKYSLTYRLGKFGTSAGGAFQILSVRGTDGKLDGADGDRWMVRFMAVPRGVDNLKPTDVFKATNVIVRIGTSFQQTVAVAAKSVRFVFKAGPRDAGVIGLSLDPKKCAHVLTTGVIDSAATDIPTSFVDPSDIDRNTRSVFPLGFDSAGFTGDTGRVIVRNNKQWAGR